MSGEPKKIDIVDAGFKKLAEDNAREKEREVFGKKDNGREEFDQLNRNFWMKAEGVGDLDYWAPKEYEAIWHWHQSQMKALLERVRKDITESFDDNGFLDTVERSINSKLDQILKDVY